MNKVFSWVSPKKVPIADASEFAVALAVGDDGQWGREEVEPSILVRDASSSGRIPPRARCKCTGTAVDDDAAGINVGN
jgi:hypothetical protein